MNHCESNVSFRSVIILLLSLGLCIGLAGCAGGTVDACPYVRNENPSLLQGRSSSDVPPPPASERTDTTGGVTAKF